jgi:hypothetical protein
MSTFSSTKTMSIDCNQTICALRVCYELTRLASGGARTNSYALVMTAQLTSASAESESALGRVPHVYEGSVTHVAVLVTATEEDLLRDYRILNACDNSLVQVAIMSVLR